MRHIFFFSYSHFDRDDANLDEFFKDLCKEVARFYDGFSADDSRVSFRDREGIPLMEEWSPALRDALQTSSVLVCVTSPRYFGSRMCGQEYYLFDQRRRFQLEEGQRPAAIILPVIWTPDKKGRLEKIDKAQWEAGDMPSRYAKIGLLDLKRFARPEYDACVVAFAQAIRDACDSYPSIPQLPYIPSAFDDIPSYFDDFGAAGAPGLGPDFANFVYVAARQEEMPDSAESYGSRPAAWRPFLKSERLAKTISDIAKSVSETYPGSYRELPLGSNLKQELEQARKRRNLTLLVADARTLPLESYQAVRQFDDVFEDDTWKGTAVLIPWQDKNGSWDQHQKTIDEFFPKRSKANPPPFHPKLPSCTEFERTLELTLTSLRSAVSNEENAKRDAKYRAPAQLVGPGAGASTQGAAGGA
jgi:TIR domain-containing protein